MLTSITIDRSLLRALDQIRKQRGIRTRAKALEIVLTESCASRSTREHFAIPEKQRCHSQKVSQQVQLDREARAKGQTVKTTAAEELRAHVPASHR